MGCWTAALTALPIGPWELTGGFVDNHKVWTIHSVAYVRHDSIGTVGAGAVSVSRTGRSEGSHHDNRGGELPAPSAELSQQCPGARSSGVSGG